VHKAIVFKSSTRETMAVSIYETNSYKVVQVKLVNKAEMVNY